MLFKRGWRGGRYAGFYRRVDVVRTLLVQIENMVAICDHVKLLH